MRGFVRTAAAFSLVAMGAAFHVRPSEAIALKPIAPADPRVSAAARANATRITQQRLDAWRSFPHVISRGNADWSSQAHRRLGWRPTAPTRSTFKSAVARGHAAAVSGPPDTVNVAFIRVDFLADRQGDASTGNGKFNLDPADTVNNPVDRPPHNRTFYRKHHEALERYYDVQSYGRVKIVGDVYPHTENGAYHLSDMADFGPWRFNHDIAGAAVEMMHTMLDSIEVQSKASGDPIPWNSIDRIVIIHAGSDLQSDLRGDSKLDIPSFTLTVSDSDAVKFADGANAEPIFQCTFVPETQNQDGFYGALNGVLAHECGHLIFGFADLYDFNTGLPVVGLFSLMDSGNLAGSLVRLGNGDEIFATGLLPPSIDPFHKSFMTDAVDFPEVSYGQVDSLHDIERHPEMRLLTQSSDEFVVLENRYLSGSYSDSVQLDQDDTTRVVLGPKSPDRFEYDALLPGGGILMWHIDYSVIPLSDALRPNPDFGVNTNRARLGVSILEGDGLGDIGDPGSPFILGSYRDPWYVGNATHIDDHTMPSLISNSKTRTHAQITVLDTLLHSMRFQADRDWRIPGWPVSTQLRSGMQIRGGFPPGGPQLLAVDVDGDAKLEVCWAGGDSAGGDSASVLAYHADGTGYGAGSGVIITLPRRPLPVLAALPTGGTQPSQGPSLLAVTTVLEGTPQPGDDMGEVWLFDPTGAPPTGWPLTPAGTRATTPPVFAGDSPNALVLVGAADGYLYAYNLDGSLRAKSDVSFGSPIAGRLAVWRNSPVGVPVGQVSFLVAAASADGNVATFTLTLPTASPTTFTRAAGWPQAIASRPGFSPDFLWLDLDGLGGASGHPTGCGSDDAPELIAHDADKLWAFCTAGRMLPGWGRSYGDTIVNGLGAGDPDGDGMPEVLIQTHSSKVAFINSDGAPSSGWPKAGSPEGVLVADSLLTGGHVNERIPSKSPPLAIDLDGNGRPEVVALNVSGIIAALSADGRTPEGWPLATGSGVSGAPLAADLDGDGKLDLVAPDRFGTLYGYALPVSAAGGTATPWTMLGGDPERTSSLPASRTPSSLAPTAGPIVPGTIKAFPNPARRKPVTIAYTLTEPSRVEVRILDTAGQEVASFRRDAGVAENVDVWNPGSVPAGLYMIHVRIKGARTEVSQTLPVGVLK